jgi:hypothetical protein
LVPAVILSKFVALQALSDVEGSEWSELMSNPGAAYLRDNSASCCYDDSDGQLLHEEARSLLVRLHGASIATAVENPSSGLRLAHRCFTVSALGQAPAGKAAELARHCSVSVRRPAQVGDIGVWRLVRPTLVRF